MGKSKHEWQSRRTQLVRMTTCYRCGITKCHHLIGGIWRLVGWHMHPIEPWRVSRVPGCGENKDSDGQ